MSQRGRTIPQLFADAVSQHARREAIVDEQTRLDYAALGEAVRRCARALMAAGIEPGNRVALQAPNIWEWAVVALATYETGGVLVPINTRFKGRETYDILDRTRAQWLFTVTDFLDTDYLGQLRDACPDPASSLPALEGSVVLRGSLPEGARSFADFLAGGTSVSEGAARVRAETVDPHDLCHILFTSGTTGRPKGAMLEHHAAVRAYTDWAEIVGLRSGDRYLLVYPFFHSAGLHAGLLSSLAMGATLIPHSVFDARVVMERVERERIAMLPGPPAIFQQMLSDPKRESFDLSSLRLSVTGSASVPVELIQRMRDELGFESVIQGYGLTEVTGIAMTCRPEDTPETIANTAGRAMPDVELRLVAEDGSRCGPGTPGEIQVRGYNVMRGYLDDPEATAASIDPEGWLATGDVGVMNDEGNISITDRLKDMFIVGGFNAYPAEIENLLDQHPEVAQVAVVGMPDARLGEVGAAFVIPQPGTRPDPDALRAWCREQMANYKVPRRFEIVSELPLTPSGKVQKFALRARLGAKSPGAA